MIKSNLGRKGLTSAYNPSVTHFIKERSQGRNWKQKLKQTPWRDTVYWLVPQDLLSLPTYPIQSRSWIALSGLDCHTSVTYQENTTGNMMEAFSN
jgi:hypothetical protein